MAKYLFTGLRYILVLVFLITGCSSNTPGNSSDIKASLGQEFDLPIGQTVNINGEGMAIKFVELTNDSRCPKGVQCIWAGEAKCQLSIVYYNNETQNVPVTIELIENGGIDGYSRANWVNNNGEYKFSFKLMPYPESGKTINSADYHLLMIINN
jgi:hypothetical protein